jgi:leucyl-tRNA synthetase
MEKYEHKQIEARWAKKWVDDQVFVPNLEGSKNPYYALFMFPYPSAEGLHIGNFYCFTCIDVMAKYKRLKGFDVFEPFGFDAFGIHLENYALKLGEHPAKVEARTTVNFRKQVQAAGLSCDYTREVDTTTPEYYKWTQWIFAELFKKGLAYQKEAYLSWCPSCKTVLADEQIEGGVCERCKTAPEKRKMKQWFFKITHYAERLLGGLPEMDWSEITKSAQKNWIGKSEGANVKFKVADSEEVFEIFTTRPDTLFGCTYCVLAPEHELVLRIVSPEQRVAVAKYIQEAAAKSELERKENKEKTGVFSGAYAVNPANQEKVPIWIADYVLAGYGFGAIMAVPAHDERDFEFAKKFNLPIRQVVAPFFSAKVGKDKPREDRRTEKRKNIFAIIKHWERDEYLCLDWEKFGWKSFIIGGVDDGESGEVAALREIKEETGYQNIKSIRRIGDEVHTYFFAAHKDLNRYGICETYFIELADGEFSEPEKEHTKNHEAVWVKQKDVFEFISLENHLWYWDILMNGEKAYAGEGKLINSEKFDGLDIPDAKKAITEFVGGKLVSNYKLRDWCISRQRYWGPPVPIVYCEKCGAVAVPEKDLPVTLPEMEKNWEPSGDGKGPLSKVESFMQTTCPECGGKATREADVMDNFLDSAWYFFRYLSPKNTKAIFDPALGKRWLPVDLYVGGNEHAVLHLMYTRFITMALHDLGLIDFDNPFKKFRANGMILKDGKKMSKSKGNVISPEEYGDKVGYDALKSYILFLGPLSEDRSFSDEGIMGTKRWAERVFNLVYHVDSEYIDEKVVLQKLHQTIKNVEGDMEEQKYNTAIAKLMELTNVFYSAPKISQKVFKKFLIITAIFLPALSEELWEKIGHAESIFKEKWPEYDLNLILDEEIELVIQVNGKVRDTAKVSVDISEEDAKKVALESEKIKKHLEGNMVKKIIFIKGRLINIVI